MKSRCLSPHVQFTAVATPGINVEHIFRAEQPIRVRLCRLSVLNNVITGVIFNGVENPYGRLEQSPTKSLLIFNLTTLVIKLTVAHFFRGKLYVLRDL